MLFTYNLCLFVSVFAFYIWQGSLQSMISQAMARSKSQGNTDETIKQQWENRRHVICVHACLFVVYWMLFVLCMSIYICVCFNYEAEILDDWNNIRSSGYGMGKRSNQNERIAQWIIADQKFEGGVYSSLFEACDYQDKKQRVQMMTWNVLCADKGKEAVVDVRVCMVIMCVCVCAGVYVRISSIRQFKLVMRLENSSVRRMRKV